MDKKELDKTIDNYLGKYVLKTCKDIHECKAILVLKTAGMYTAIRHNTPLEMITKLEDSLVELTLIAESSVEKNLNESALMSSDTDISIVTINTDTSVSRSCINLPVGFLKLLHCINSLDDSGMCVYRVDNLHFESVPSYVELHAHVLKSRLRPTNNTAKKIATASSDEEYSVKLDFNNSITIKSKKESECIFITGNGTTGVEYLRTLIDSLHSTSVKGLSYTYRNPYKIIVDNSAEKSVILQYIDVNDEFKTKCKKVLSYGDCGGILKSQTTSITAQELALICVHFGLMYIDTSDKFQVTQLYKGTKSLRLDAKIKKPTEQLLVSKGFTIPDSYRKIK